MGRPSEAGDRLSAGIETLQKKSQQYCWPSDGDIHSLVGGACSCKAFDKDRLAAGPWFSTSLWRALKKILFSLLRIEWC